MKSLILAALVAMSATLLASCTTEAPKQKNDVYILVDNTDKVKYKEDVISSDVILNLVGKKGTVKFRSLTGVSINEESEISLLVDGSTSVLRQDQIDPFVQKLDSLKKKYLSITTEYKKSSLWEPVCEALNTLSAAAISEPGEKTMIIVSDMLENSEYCNFYKETDYGQVKVQLSKSGFSLPKKGNVKVIILFNPNQDNEKERLHKKAMKFWEELFKEAGIKFVERANLNTKV